MLSSYYTVKQDGTHEINIQKSRFIGYIGRVSSEEKAQSFIQSIKKKHYDATHNCSAYLIGKHDQIQKANDDGEPGGTAGVPMLEVLKRQQLKNTVVVVTRYFGGIKLGAGGLIRAYSRTTADTIRHVGVVECRLVDVISVTIDYSLLGKLENNLHQSNYIIENTNYLEHVELIVLVQSEEVDIFKKEMIEWTNDQLTMKHLDQKYIEV